MVVDRRQILDSDSGFHRRNFVRLEKLVMVCTYDNPTTMRRECWQDGKLIYWYSASLLLSKGMIPPRYFFLGANIGPWKTGQLIGDRKAMDERYQD